MRLTQLFAGFGSGWPSDVIGLGWPPSDDGIASLLLQIDDSIEVHEVITDVAPDGTLTVGGTLKSPTPPAPTELVLPAFPSLRFVFTPDIGWSSGFRASVGLDGTVTVQVDDVPLQVLMPSDLLRAHPTLPAADTGITLSGSTEPSVVSRSFAVTLEASGDLLLAPHLPISIGPCTLFGISMRAVHDVQLLASPGRAHMVYDWVVRELNPGNFSMDCGGLGFGGLQFDWSDQDSSLANLRRRLRIAQHAEFVFEDLVLPAVFVPPIPQHGTFGLRKSLQPGESLLDHFTFRDSPVFVPLGDSAHLFISQLYYQMPPEGESLLSGLSVEAGIAFDARGDAGGGGSSDDDDPPPEEDWEIELGLIDGHLLRLSVARTPPPAGEEVPIIRLDLFSHSITFFRARFGVSITALQESGFDGDAIQALTDILVEKKPDEPANGGSSGDSAVQIRSEDGRDFKAAITDLGWDQGKPSFELTTPRGATLELGPFALVLYETGLAAEHGATYISLSGGIRAKIDPFTGKLWFIRLRGRLAGNPDAPNFKLGGLGVEIEVKDVVEVRAHGHFRDELLADGTRIKEQGLGGELVIYAGSNKWGLSADVYWGERIPPVDPRIDYLLFQVVLFGAIPMGPVELSQIEALYADSLVPKIEASDREAGELKYYSWLKRARPTGVAEERGLTAWTPQNDAWAFGLGLGISFTGCGDVCRLTAFGLGFDSEDAAGLVIVLELKLFGGDKPLALGIFEYDFRTDAFVLQIQIDLTLDQLIENFPEELKLKLGGTFVFGNKPGLVAIGRLDHPDTWIGGTLAIDLFDVVVLELHLAVCFEWLEGSYIGGGFTFSLSAKGDLGVIRLEGWGSLLVVLKWMSSGTNDFVARIAFKAGFALVLFGFLRFGISVNLLAEWLAHRPNFFVFRVTFRLETPWFLPDVSFTLECVKGELSPAERGIVTGPLLDASARGLAGPKRVELERIDGRSGGAEPALFSVVDLQSATGSWQGDGDLVPLDATIEIRFSPMLEDRLGIAPVGLNPDLGLQVTGDDGTELTARYQLTGLRVRRRPVGGAAWTVVEHVTETDRTKTLRWRWDADTRTGGETAPKKLFLNGDTPFSVGYENPVADDELLDEFPGFPCCDPRRPDVAIFDFSGRPFEPLPTGFVDHFTFLRRRTRAPIRIAGGPCSIRPPIQSGADNDRVAGFDAPAATIAITSQEDLGRALVNVAVVGARSSALVVVARDRLGQEVFRNEMHVAGNASFVPVDIQPATACRSIDIRLLSVDEHQDGEPEPGRTGSLVLDFAECVTAADLARWESDKDACEQAHDNGDSVVNLLAQHEYEITIGTRVSVRHTTTEWESVDLDESVRFVTAGPPGLNEVPEPGLELEPHVISASAGGRGILYREESVHLVFGDTMRVFGPGSGGVDESDYRLPVTLTVETVFDGKPEDHPHQSSFSNDEWFLARRGLATWHIAVVLSDLIPAVTSDPLRLRLRDLWEASTGTCEPEEVWIEDRPRLGVDPFDAAGRPLWEPRTTYHAAMRPVDGPVVERRPFETADLAAFTMTNGTWSVSDGRLETVGSATAGFGDPDWDLYHLELVSEVDAGGEIGAGVLLGGAGGGLRITVERHTDGGGRLVARNAASGAVVEAVAIDAVDETVALLVDVFVDSIRASGGGETLVIPRDGRTAGTCALGGTAVSIRLLRVRALEMYGFDFSTSRYASFAAHIETAAGAQTLEIGGAESLGTLLTRTAGDITAAMQATASDADRERVFVDIASSLAMPLQEDPARLNIEVGANGADRWIVLESPEPIDFVEEVTVRLERKVPLPPIDERYVEMFLRITQQELGDDIPIMRPPRRGPRETLLDRIGAEDPPSLLGGIWPQPRAKAVLTVALDGNDLVVTAVRSDKVRRIPLSTPIPRRIRSRIEGLTLEFDTEGQLAGWTSLDGSDWQKVDVTPIQNADATKTFILPTSAAVLVDGCYRATFTMSRRWFATISPTSSENTYLDEAETVFLIGS